MLPVQPCDDSCVPTCCAVLTESRPCDVIREMGYQVEGTVDRRGLGWLVEEATDYLSMMGVLRGVFNARYGTEERGPLPIDWQFRMGQAMDRWPTGLVFGGCHCVVLYEGKYYDPRGFWLDQPAWPIDIFVGCEYNGPPLRG